MKFTTQMMLLIGAAFFLMKGGLGFMVAAWKLVLPILFVSGAYYMIRKAISPPSASQRDLNRSNDRSERFQSAPKDEKNTRNDSGSGVIEICPYCLSEVGSCPKCRKGKKFF